MDIQISLVSTTTLLPLAQWSDGTEDLSGASDQQTSKGITGMYKGFRNPNLPTTEFGGKLILKD